MNTTLMMCVCCQSWPATLGDLCEGCERGFREQEQAPPPKHADYRFTADDEQTIRDRVQATYVAWADGRKPGTFTFDHDRLRRIAANAIACSLLDLRDCEIIWIDELIADVSSPF